MSEAKIFKYFVRVPYAHTDQMRFVYYANYLVYFEMARAAMLRETGLPYGELEKQGVFLPVVEAHCAYKTPAHYDDELKIVSRCEIKGVRLRVEYEVFRGNDLIVTGYTVHACVSADLKIIRPPVFLQKLVAAPPP
ncbi:MAG: thioesterase family protein [Kiritimatiellae bacterium]|nr:thioesterase family protein [Kiritimatiellia bacterium]